MLTIGMLFAGCAFKAQYKPELLATQLSLIEAKFDGKALVFTEPKEDLTLYKQGPSSFTGAATSLSVNVGGYLKEISVEVFSRFFKEGAVHSNKQNEPGDYVIIIKPEILTFDYRYNQLKNLGFAITPETKIDLYVSLKDPQGKVLLEKKYESDYLSGGSYMASLKPQDKINRSIHESIYNLLMLVARDIENVL